jgi:hypothetical protein
MAVQAPGFAEDKIGAALAAVKALNPNISGVFYYNSAMDWPVSRHTFPIAIGCIMLSVAVSGYGRRFDSKKNTHVHVWFAFDGRRFTLDNTRAATAPYCLTFTCCDVKPSHSHLWDEVRGRLCELTEVVGFGTRPDLPGRFIGCTRNSSPTRCVCCYTRV